jgi:hypothetical protein
LNFKENVPALAGVAFTVNGAHVDSIGNYLYIYIAESVTLQLHRLNRARVAMSAVFWQVGIL